MSQNTEVPELKRLATFNGKGWKEYKIFVYKNESTVLRTFVKFVAINIADFTNIELGTPWKQ